jgi:hypothetical protein
METKELKLYNFQELSLEVQDKVIDINRDILTENRDWYDFTVTDFEEILENIGFYNIKCYFSGFYSQDDGASFEAEYGYKKGALSTIKTYAPNDNHLKYLVEQIQKLQKSNFYSLSAKVERISSRYYHSNTMIINEMYRDDNKSITEDTIDTFRGLCRELADYLYNSLEKEYDYLTSDKSIREYLENEDSLYLENGVEYEW